MLKDRDLDKQIRLIGKSSSSKTTILHTFASKMSVPINAISIPVSTYLTLDRFKEKVEENYKFKR